MIAEQTLSSPWIIVPLLGAAGFAVGRGYFASLLRGVRRSVAGGSWPQFTLSVLTRVALAALFFAFAAHWGAPALLPAFAGFLTARHRAVRIARRLA